MDSIKRLTDLFSKFPTIDKGTAGRFVFYLLKQPRESVDELIRAIEELKNNVKLCSFCFNPYESEGTLCAICQNPNRNKQLLCIVEKEADLNSLENTKRYAGLYFILGGNASISKINAIENLRIPELVERIKKHNFTEIILATNPTPAR